MAVNSSQGGLNWVAGINTEQINKDAQKIVDIIDSASKKVSSSQKSMQSALSQTSKQSVEDGLFAIRALPQELQKSLRIVSSFQVEINQAKEAQSRLSESFQRGEISASKYNEANAGLTVRINQLNGQIRTETDLIRQKMAVMEAEKGSIIQKRALLTQLTTQYNALSASERTNIEVGGRLASQIRRLDRELSIANRSLSSTVRNSRVFNQVLGLTASLFSIQQGARFARDIVRVRGEIEQLEVAFSTILKSKARADELMSDVIGIATTTPFTITEVANATKQLLAYGFAQSEIERQLRAVGNVASGVGATFQEVAYAYGTLRSQGRAFQRDIRQFTTRGIPIIEELANVMNVAEDRVQDLVSAGKVGFPEVEKAFANMTGEGGIFFELMEKQSQTVTGEIAKLQDRIQLMYNEIGESNEGFIRNVIQGSSYLVENYESVAKIITTLIAVYGTYRAALALNIALTKANSKATLSYAAVLDLLRTKMIALRTVAMTMGAIGLAIGAIALVTTAVMAFSKEVEKAENIQDRLNKVNQETSTRVSETSTKINLLVKSISDENQANAVRLKAYEDLKGLAPEILENLTFEEAKNQDLTKSVYDYIDALKERIRVESLVNQAVELAQKRQAKEQELLDLSANKPSGNQGQSNTVFQGNERYEIELKQLNTELERLAASEKAINEEISRGFNGSENALKEKIKYFKSLQDAVGETSKLYDEYQKEIDKINELINKPVELKESRNVAFFKNIIKENQELIDELDKDSKDFEKQKKEFETNILNAQEELEAFEIESTKKTGKKKVDLREQVYKELAKMEDEAFRKSFDKRHEDLAKLTVQLENFKEKAIEAGFTEEEYNKLIGNFKRQREADISFRSETEKLKLELEKQKVLYEEYENYVREFGLASAEKKFSGQLDLTQSYFEKLKLEYDNLANIAPDQLSGVESERLAMIEPLLIAEQRRMEQYYETLLIQTQDYETQRAKITQKYIMDMKLLKGEENEANRVERERQYFQELNDLDFTNIQKLDSYKRYFNEVGKLSNKDAKSRLSSLKEELTQFMEINEVTDEVRKAIEDIIRLSEDDIDKKLQERVGSIAQNIQLIAGGIGDMNKGLSASLGLFSNLLRSAVQVRQSLRELKEAQTANDSLGTITAGIGVAGAAISGGLMIANFFKNIKAQDAEVQQQAVDFANQIQQANIRLNKIIKDRAIEMAIMDGNSLKTTIAQIEIEEKNIEKLTQTATKFSEFFMDTFGRTFEQMETLFEKGQLSPQNKEYFEQWKAIREQIEGSDQAIQDLEGSMRDMLLGSQDWSGIADSLIEGFQEGKRAAEDFGDDMEDIIRRALLSGFKYRFLEEPLQQLLDDLFEDAKEGDSLSGDEINRFKAAYGKIVEEYGRVFDDLSNATGINLGQATSQGSALRNEIKREITEQTASVLAGLARAQYDILKRSHNTAIENLQWTMKIEQNTFNTVGRLDLAITELRNIVRNTKPAQNSRDTGLGG